MQFLYTVCIGYVCFLMYSSLQVRLRSGGDCEECSVMVHVSGGVYHVLKAGSLLCHGKGSSFPIVVREGSVFDSLPYRGCENKLMVFFLCVLTVREGVLCEDR